MKFWVMAIFAVYGKLRRMVELLDEQIDGLSVQIVGDTYQLFDRVIALNDKKRCLVNLKVLGDMLKKLLDKDEFEIVVKHAKGKTFEEIALMVSLSKSSVNRKFLKAIEKCTKHLEALTYNEERLLEEYKDLPGVFKVVKKMGYKTN